MKLISLKLKRIRIKENKKGYKQGCKDQKCKDIEEFKKYKSDLKIANSILRHNLENQIKELKNYYNKEISRLKKENTINKNKYQNDYKKKVKHLNPGCLFAVRFLDILPAEFVLSHR